MTDRNIGPGYTYASLEAATAAASSGDHFRIRANYTSSNENLDTWLRALDNCTLTQEGASAQILDYNAWRPGLLLTITGGRGLTFKPHSAGAYPDIRGGCSIVCDDDVTIQSLDSNGFRSGFGTGTVTLNGSTLSGVAGGAGTDWIGSGGNVNLTMTGGTIDHAHALVNDSAGSGTVVFRRVTATNLYYGAQFSGGSVHLEIKESLLSTAQDGIRFTSAAGAPVVDLGGVTIANAAGQAITCTVPAPAGTVTVNNCWGATVDRIAGWTWDYNAYTTRATGAAGAHDVVTAAPAFVGGSNYHTLPASPLRGAGMVTAETLDLDGVTIGTAPDIGCYFAPPDCGISSAIGVDSLSFLATFAPVSGGDAYPLEISAIDETKWTVTPSWTDPTYAILRAVKVSAYVYRAYTTHRGQPGRTATVNTAAIRTNASGYCKTPPSAVLLVIGDYVPAVTPEFPQVLGPADTAGGML